MTNDRHDRELRKLEHDARPIVVHIKAPYREETLNEIKALGIPRLEIVRDGEYEF